MSRRDYNYDVSWTKGGQGRLFRTQGAAHTEETRWPKGFSPERREEARATVDPLLQQPEKEHPKISERWGQWRSGITDNVARSTVPMEDFEGLNQIQFWNPDYLGQFMKRGWRGAYAAEDKNILIPNAEDTEGTLRNTKSIVHELGHHVSHTNEMETSERPWWHPVQKFPVAEEGRAEAYAEHHLGKDFDSSYGSMFLELGYGPDVPQTTNLSVFNEEADEASRRWEEAGHDDDYLQAAQFEFSRGWTQMSEHLGGPGAPRPEVVSPPAARELQEQARWRHVANKAQAHPIAKQAFNLDKPTQPDAVDYNRALEETTGDRSIQVPLSLEGRLPYTHMVEDWNEKAPPNSQMIIPFRDRR